MRSRDNTAATLSELLAGHDHEAVARDGLEQLHAYVPLRFEAPPQFLASAIERARQLARNGNKQAAAQTVANIANEKGTAIALGTYREHVTWVEHENARKLSALACIWHTLHKTARTDVALHRKLVQLERFARDHYGVNELRITRGWSEQQTRAEHVLPRAWRSA